MIKEEPASEKKYKHRRHGVVVILMVFLFSLLSPLHAEYYEYTDENGVKIFTDDQSLVPAGKARVHKERFDGLDEVERQRRIEREAREIERMNREVEDRLKRYEEKEAAERERKAEIARKKRLAALKTPVTIRANQILVPVTFRHQARTVTVPLLLDTGASITTINDSVTRALNITQGKASTAVVAGGGILHTRIVRVDQLRVGPNAMGSKNIMVFPEKGPDFGYKGLLGQDFLKHFSFSIDYDGQMIQWTE